MHINLRVSQDFQIFTEKLTKIIKFIKIILKALQNSFYE